MFTPRYIKHGKLLLRHAQKFLHYRRDVLSETELTDLKNHIDKLHATIKQRDERAVREASEQLDALLASKTPVNWETHWRENCEVILVAIIVAVGIRTYFLQPFKIPTGSMQPTLNGIIGHPSMDPAPNIFQQVAEYIMLGRNYINVVSQQDDQIEYLAPKKFAFFFTFTRIVCQHQNFLVYAPPETLRGDFHLATGNTYHRGDVIARGAIDTGDQVFVDKFTYNFAKPHHGDVFVFRTDHIFGIPDDPETGAPFFIKRLGGVPGDTLRIDSPLLYIDGKLAPGIGFRRVMSAKPPYRGYAPGRDYLAHPMDSYTIPEHRYFALGDNSFNSYDSRYWGPVPQENLVGRGLFVYWPFNRHWGIIR